MDKPDWQLVTALNDNRANPGGIELMTRQLTAGARLSAGKRTAGASALDFGGPSGSSLPSVLATGSPLSTFQYTLSRADRLGLFRYWSRTDPFVGRALEIHSELPMSRLTIGPPKGPSTVQNRKINRVYESMAERLDFLSFLLEFSREYWLTGDVYIWLEWNDEIHEWDDIYILPCEYCHSILHPFNRRKEIVFFARPLVDTAAIRRMTDRDMYLVADAEIEKLYESLGDEVPEELKDALNYGEAVPLNTNWRNGSYCVHIPRNRPPNEEYGQSLLERCTETLLRLENLKNAQLQISSRNMNPKHLIYAPGIAEPQLNDLRTQVDLALLENTDYPIVTNFEVVWNTIGANDRLLSLGEEYSTLREDLATGLGTTKEMLTGAASYAGQRMTLEMMNTQYLTYRELVRRFVEECVFRPVADSMGHYYKEQTELWLRVKPSDIEVGDTLIQETDGVLRRKRVQSNIVWNHSSLRFNRLSIRDNAEVYDQLFQLYQKGSLASRYLLDLHNIDPEENSSALVSDLGTPQDPVLNELVRSIYTGSLAQVISETTDIADRVVQGLGLEYKTPQQQKQQSPPGSDIGGGFGGMGGGLGSVGPMGDLGSPTGVEGMPGAEDQVTMGAAPGGFPPEVNPPVAASSRKAEDIYLLGTPLSEEVTKNLMENASPELDASPSKVRKLVSRLERGISRVSNIKVPDETQPTQIHVFPHPRQNNFKEGQESNSEKRRATKTTKP